MPQCILTWASMLRTGADWGQSIQRSSLSARSVVLQRITLTCGRGERFSTANRLLPRARRIHRFRSTALNTSQGARFLNARTSCLFLSLGAPTPIGFGNGARSIYERDRGIAAVSLMEHPSARTGRIREANVWGCRSSETASPVAKYAQQTSCRSPQALRHDSNGESAAS
jgi:hypothetical protein